MKTRTIKKRNDSGIVGHCRVTRMNALPNSMTPTTTTTTISTMETMNSRAQTRTYIHTQIELITQGVGHGRGITARGRIVGHRGNSNRPGVLLGHRGTVGAPVPVGAAVVVCGMGLTLKGAGCHVITLPNIPGEDGQL